MRDRYIVFEDGRRTFVRDLTDAEIQESLDMLDGLTPMDGTDASHHDMRERLLLEQTIRARAALT
jgi:hypothetical protein